MDKLLNEHLDNLGIKGPLAEILRFVCCYDFGPWVKPARKRDFFTNGELRRAHKLALRILADGNMDALGIFMINEHVVNPNKLTVFRVPKDQYPRMPINYHIGLNEVEIPEGGETTYENMAENGLFVPVQLFATIFGPALGRHNPWTCNTRLIQLNADEIVTMIDLENPPAVDVLKAAFIFEAMGQLFPGGDVSTMTIDARRIPSVDHLEHFSAIWGDLITPTIESHLIQLLDSARFYGEKKYYEGTPIALLRTDDGVVYVASKAGFGPVMGELADLAHPETINDGNFVLIPPKFLQVFLDADPASIIGFFGGEPSVDVNSLQLNAPAAGGESFQLDPQ